MFFEKGVKPPYEIKKIGVGNEAKSFFKNRPLFYSIY